jgi:hypothetical protein
MLFSIYHNLSGSLYFIGYEVSEQMHIHLFFVMTQIHSKIMLLMHSMITVKRIQHLHTVYLEEYSNTHKQRST